MASVKWEGGKYHGAGETKAHFRHDEKEQRLAHEHANEHINKELTPFNYSMNGLSYAEMCEKYDKRIAELAPNTRMTKVTVTCQSLEVPAPADLPKDSQPEWFRRVHEIITDFAGEENVIEGIVHVDELHEYTDASTGKKRMSMEHLHETVVPEVGGKLNGKEFSLRKNIKKLNNAIHEMSVKEFGVKFHTGKGKKSSKSVEELKNESATLEAAQEIVSAEYADLCADLDVERMLAGQELDERLAQEAHEAHEQLEAELEAKQKKAEAKLNANIGPRIRAVYEREQALKVKEADLNRRATDIIMYEDYLNTLTDDFNALSDEQKKTLQARTAKGKINKTQAFIKAEKERQLRKAFETSNDAWKKIQLGGSQFGS